MSFGIVYVVVSSRHRQRMAMIEKGIDLGQLKDREVPLRTLRNGLVLMAVGLGLFLGKLVERYMPTVAEEVHLSHSPLPYFIMVTLCVGAALIAHHLMAQKRGLGK